MFAVCLRTKAVGIKAAQLLAISERNELIRKARKINFPSSNIFWVIAKKLWGLKVLIITNFFIASQAWMFKSFLEKPHLKIIHSGREDDGYLTHCWPDKAFNPFQADVWFDQKSLGSAFIICKMNSKVAKLQIIIAISSY